MSNPGQQPPVYPPPNQPADQPTAPLQPVPDRYPPQGYAPDPYAADARAAWRLEGLRTALTIVGLLAVIAIGLAVWALIRENNRHATNTSPGTPAAIAALTNRMNHLDALIRSSSTATGTKSATTQALNTRLTNLEQAQTRLAKQVGRAGSTAQVSQLASKEAALSAKVSQLVGKEASLSGQVSQLQGKVAALSGQVSQLNASSGTQTNTTGTGTGTGTGTTP